MSEKPCMYLNQQNGACTFPGKFTPSFATEISVIRGVDKVCRAAMEIKNQQKCTGYEPVTFTGSVIQPNQSDLIE